MDYGKSIRILRAAKGLTQRQLADLIEADASYISMVESGKRPLTSDKLNDLANALGVPQVLITFIASEQDDLKGLTEDQALEMNRALLSVIFDEKEK